ncbi:MAG: WxL protein peptidoglycan domain-containing protein, partial [Thermomicrobiales bacterium]
MMALGNRGRIAVLALATLLGNGLMAPVMAQDAATPAAGTDAAAATPDVLDDNGMPMLSATAVGMEKPYFEASLKPGESATFTVKVGNYGAKPERVRLYPADVYTRINGGFEAKLAGEPISGTTQWVSLKDEIFELKPAETVDREFTVTVPEGTTPGDYLCSVVMQTADPVKGTGAVAINQIL